MKIAVHYFGHVRTFRDCIPTHLEYLFCDAHEFEVYVHTWNQTNRTTASWYEVIGDVVSLDKDDENFLNEVLRPVRIIIEPQNLTDVDQKLRFVSSIKMHESIRKSIRLRLDIKFKRQPDLVVIIRPDILLKNRLDLAYLAEVVRDPWLRYAILSPTYHHPPSGMFQTDRLAACDSILIGSHAATACLSSIGIDRSIYHKFERYNQVGEIFFDNFLYSKNVRSVPLEFIAPRDWEILRK